MMRHLPVLVLGAALALLPAAAPAQEVVHGADSLFVSPSVKLAWVVRRGASEADTIVVVRIAAADAAYRLVRVDGVDPFTGQHKVFVATRPLDRETDVAIPRAQFADHPSTEFRFFASAEDAAADKAKLTVFYLGVPDTTPEFPGQRDAEAYLARMLGR
jgi:hypothetical protein